jgi:hypothetical protein
MDMDRCALSHSGAGRRIERSAVMKVSRQMAFRIAVIVVAITAFLAAPGVPSGGVFGARQTASFRPGSGHVRTIPVSDRMITLKITGDDGHEVEASQLEGGLIRIEKASGAIYGFSPLVRDSSNEMMTIKVYRIGVSEAGGVVGETLSEVNALVVGKASQYFTADADAEASFKIKVLDVQTALGSSRGSLNSPETLSECCAGCKGEISCACRVSTPCGACCSGTCCYLTQ